MDISKIKIGGEVCNISPFSISYTEPQGDARLPMWICPTTNNMVNDFYYTTSSKSIDGTTKYMVAYYYIDSEGIFQQSISDYIYSSSSDAAASIPSDKKVVIICKSYKRDETTYQITNLEKQQVYPNMDYTFNYYYYHSSPNLTVPLKIFWYDTNEDLLASNEIVLSTSSGTIDLGKSPENACYCLITMPYGYLEESSLNIDVEHNDSGTYILNPDNNMYYKIN